MPTTMLQLPDQIAGLEDLAFNLRWSWTPGSRALFERIDSELWTRSHHNPVRLIRDQPTQRRADLAADQDFTVAVERQHEDLSAYLRQCGSDRPRRIAYFSAEFAVVDCIRVFSGGLGVLAGDHLKSASDLGLPLVGVGLLYRQGYFTQRVDADGRQHETYRQLDPTELPLRAELCPDGTPRTVSIEFPGRTVHVRIWRADVGAVPLYLLDTDVEGNATTDRQITDRLYGGDLQHRLEQELVLGIGGVRALSALGHDIETWHLNEGHAAFVALERLGGAIARGADSVDSALAAVRNELVFTTHTPVEAGHDYFPGDLIASYLGPGIDRIGMGFDRFYQLGLTTEPHRAGQFCMTALALRCARTSNGVSALHGKVSRAMWRELYGAASADEVPIGHVTNGVHLPTWVGFAVAAVYVSRVAADWQSRSGDVDWTGILAAPHPELWAARRMQRTRLIDRLKHILAAQADTRGAMANGRGLDPDALTITFARRFATYKRATLPLTDLDRLAAIVGSTDRPVQIIFAGKAHPRDEPGKGFIQQVFAASHLPEMRGRIVFVENYDVELARLLVQGSDVWLNLPRRPLEASGTSGMKSAANGGLNLSVTDGWWAEAWSDHNTLPAPIGWAIESAGQEGAGQDASDAETLYRLLEEDVVPLFYDRDERGVPAAWLDRVGAAMAQVCGFFNTDRMVAEYARAVYRSGVSPRLHAPSRLLPAD